MTVAVQWLLRGSNGVVILGLVFAVVGTFYSAPDLFRRKTPVLGELAQCLITGAVGGLALGIVAVINLVLIANTLRH